MRITVASGKGGTGKTLISTNLAWCLAEQGRRVRYVDTDVEAPNGHLFLHPKLPHQWRFAVPVPGLNSEDGCSGCGVCQQACNFNAILALKDRVMVIPELCHSCGVCVLSCPEKALTEVPRQVGLLRNGCSGGIDFHDALLDIGEAKAPPLIGGLLQQENAAGAADVVLLDAPPGTSCSAMAAVRSADLVLLVTEPTPFGLHDLKLAVEMCDALGKQVKVVINRADLGDRKLNAWLRQRGIPVLAEVPFSRLVAEVYAAGGIVAEQVSALRRALQKVGASLLEEGP